MTGLDFDRDPGGYSRAYPGLYPDEADIDEQDYDDPDDYNYVYDRVGNLLWDHQSDIGKIEWNAYGKINAVQKTTLINVSRADFG
jgi:hypothetical protein